MPHPVISPRQDAGQDGISIGATPRIGSKRVASSQTSVDSTVATIHEVRRSGRTLSCELHCHSNSKHLQHVYTGFSLLRRRGLIDVRQYIVNDPFVLPQRVQHLRNARHAHLRVVVNGALRLHYDTHDSQDIDEEYLAQADYYFKRSYSESYLRSSGYDRSKIHPLGLYYEVYPEGVDIHRLARILKLDRGIEAKVRKLLHAVPKLRTIEALPDYAAPARILFNVKAWDPFDQPDRIQEKIEERMHLNEMRASCVRLLKKEFGAAFLGGFVHSAYARQHYSDLLLPQKGMASKNNYMELLKSFPICVATTGLHGSIGAKFAEYICLSKAILSEKLLYSVPGDLREGHNYLQFATPTECVEQARRLYEAPELRHRLMSNNARYYNTWLRPDLMVLNTVLVACARQGA